MEKQTDCLQHCDQIPGLVNIFIYTRPSMSSSRCSSWIQKGQRNQRSNCQHSWIIKKDNFRKTSTSVSLTTIKLLTLWITTNCVRFLKRWEYQATLPASWEICMQARSNVRTIRGTMDWFQIGKEVCQGCILSPCLFN